jgi:hypothetical protein
MTGDWSAIPVPVPYATFENPQSLNLYMYRTPINTADLDGHAPGDQPLPDVKHMEGTKPEPNSVKDKAGAQNKESSKKTGFWSRLGQHLGNLFSGRSWNYGMRESVTHTIELASEPTPYVKAATDAAGIVAAVSDNAKLGAATAVISLANDHGVQNIMLTGAGFVPDLSVPSAFIGAEADLLGFVAQDVMEGMINAIPGEKMDDGNGHLIPNPGLMNECDGVGCK